METRKAGEQQIRNLTQNSSGSYQVSLPKQLVSELRWRQGQKVTVSKVGDRLIIEDWKEQVLSSTSTGREAEEAVAKHLESIGHKIVALNWRTRWCEIDIVSKDKKCVYFTEVKYRGSDAWGGGFEYIGAKKQKQMRFAAEFWLHENGWKKESQLQAAEVNINGEINLVSIDL